MFVVFINDLPVLDKPLTHIYANVTKITNFVPDTTLTRFRMILDNLQARSVEYWQVRCDAAEYKQSSELPPRLQTPGYRRARVFARHDRVLQVLAWNIYRVV